MSQPDGGIVEVARESSVLTSAHVAPVSRNCLNCGAPVALAFCGQCGQRVADPDPTLRELLEELAGELLHWDGKLWATVKTLVRRPGALTVEYLAGRRTSYISPLKLYLSASVLYFFVSAVAPRDPSDQGIVRIETRDDSRAGTSSSTQASAAATPEVISDDGASRGTGLRARTLRRIDAGAERAVKDPGAFSLRIRDQLGTVVFVILPAFAFAVGLAYRGQRRHYPQHLIFALHVHAVVFAGLACIELLRFLPRSTARTAIDLLAMAALGAYLVAALRQVYGGTVGRTLAKAVTLGLVYFGFFALGMGALVVYGFLTI